MKDLTRFRVIEGGKTPGVRKRVTSVRTGRGLTEQWEHYKCGECSDELGFPFSQLHEVRTNTLVTTARGSAGKVLGGQSWLACPRCHQLRFQLEGRQPANDGQSDRQQDTQCRPVDQEG